MANLQGDREFKLEAANFNVFAGSGIVSKAVFSFARHIVMNSLNKLKVGLVKIKSASSQRARNLIDLKRPFLSNCADSFLSLVFTKE